MNLKQRRDLIILLILMSVMIGICSLDFIPYNNISFSQLEDSIAEIETKIGDYSDFYIVVDKENNNIEHTISSFGLDNQQILLLPNTVNLTNIVVDFYTIWDENLGSYSCNFNDNNTYIVKGKEIKVVQSDMQFVYIDLASEDLQRVNYSYREGHEEKEIANISLTTKNITVDGQIKPRGEATWNLYNKLPYSIKLNKKGNYFDLGLDKKWNLLANATDKTLLKNEEFFKMAKKLNLAYTPKIKNIHLYINDSYQGVYSVSTKVKEGKNTVPLNRGDFLLNWGAPNYETKVDYDCNFWTSDDEYEDNSYVDVVYPEHKDILKEEQKQVHYIVQNFVDTIEQGNNADFNKVMDMESFAKYYWVQEISMNADGWFRSTYMYYLSNTKKLYAGPLWDLEWSLDSYLTANHITFTQPYGWKLRQNGYYPYLFENEEFVKEVERVYKEYDIESLMYMIYNDYIEQAEKIDLEGDLNYTLWKDENNFYNINMDAQNYKEWVKERTDFFKARIDWIAKEMK